MAASVPFSRGATGPRLLLAACVLLGVSACGGGGGGSDGGAVALAPAGAAALTGVSSNSAEVGGSIVVSGSNLNLVGTFRLGDVALVASNVTPTSATLTMPATPAAGALTMLVGSASVDSGYRIEAYVALAVTAMAPEAGAVGASVTLSGRGLAGVTAVRFSNGVLATLPAERGDGSLTILVPPGAASGKLSLAGTYNQFTTAGEFEVVPAMSVDFVSSSEDSAAVNVVVLGHGLARVGAARIGQAKATVVSASDTEVLLSAPLGSSGSVVLTAPGYAALEAGVVAAAGAQGVRIGGLDFAQVFSRGAGDPKLLLTQDKGVVVRAAVLGTAAGQASPAVSLSAYSINGVLLGQMAMSGPAYLPLSKDNYNLNSTFNALLQGAWVRPGVKIRVTAGAAAAAVFQEAKPAVAAAAAIRVVLVPLQTGTGLTVLPSTALVREALARTYPYAAANITVTQRRPLAVGGSSSNLSWWTDTLADLEDIRLREDPGAFYYAFAPTYTDPSARTHTAGMAYLADRATGSGATSALGLDATWRDSGASDPFGNNWPEWLTVMLHELGHNHALKHVACGAPANTDPAYPYPDGDLGELPLYNSVYQSQGPLGELSRPVAIGQFGGSGKMKDVMSYCDGAWLSDYSYDLAQQFAVNRARSSVQGRVLAKASPAPAAGFLNISGSISRGALQLRPAAASSARLHEEASGQHHAYVLRVVTVAGQTFEQAFDAQMLADGALDTGHFRVSLPHPGEVAGIEVLHNGKTLPQMESSRTTAPAKSGVGFSGKVNKGTLELRWDADAEPTASVLHVAANGTRTVLATALRGGSAALDVRALPAGGRFEVSLATTLNARMLTIPQ